MSQRAYFPWTAEQDELLRQLWPDPSLKLSAIAERLGRSDKAIGYHANQLNLGPKPMTTNEWAEDKVSLLRSMHRDGRSYREIAKALGVTRNAVCGKANRLGLSDPSRATKTNYSNGMRQRPVAVRPPPVPKVITPPKAAPVRAPKVKAKVSLAPPAPNAEWRILMDLERGMCRWPVGEDPGVGNGDRQLFCAAVAADDCSYCSHHAKRGHQKNRSPEEVAMLVERAAKARAAKRPGALQFSHKRAA